MHPVFFEIFGFPIHVYGVLIAGGFLLAMNLSRRQAGREGENPEQIADIAFLALVAGIIGARVVFVFTKLDEYLANPIDILLFWRGGVVFYGGFIAAAVMIIYYCRKHRLDYFKIVDILVPYLALGHAFGRLGCLAAGCCFGKPTELPWGIEFPLHSMVHIQQQTDLVVGASEQPLAVHPTQLYESGVELVLFAFLLWFRRYKRFHGQLFLCWLALYAPIRSLIEVLRGDRERGLYYGLSTSQWISLAVAATAVVLFFALRSRRFEVRRQEPNAAAV